METTYFSLASKGNFNKALRHFYAVNDVVDEVESRKNLADVINNEIDSGEIVADQILPIVGSVIRDKYGYSFSSFSIPAVLSDFQKIVDVTMEWTGLEIVIIYYNPGGEVIAINPKNAAHWARARELSHDQLAVIYVKDKREGNLKTEDKAINAMKDLLSGKDVYKDKDFVDSTVAAKPPAQKPVQVAAAIPDDKKQMTPKYGVQVSNELFHNGNVEAWKKILESYQVKYPNLQTYVYFEGELINDINALFKWGKVKHGDSIFFQVGGDNIVGVSKLKKYLYEGASTRFEQFLKIGVGKVLNLF